MAEKTMNIYQRMLAISAEISNVAKNLEVGWGQNKYRAVGEVDVLAAVKPLEEKYGVYSYPCSRQIVDSGEIVNVKEDRNGEKKETRQLYIRIATTYRFVNVDDPSDFIETISYGDGVDSQDKAPGKAATYSDKYCLMKMYKVQTGDDPDANASGELKNRTRKNPDAAPEVPATITEKEQNILKEMCAKAGKDISKVFPNGLNLTSAQYSQAVQTLTGWIQKVENK